MISRVVATLVLAMVLAGCTGSAAPPRQAPAPAAAAIHFDDVTEQAGIDFHHTNGATGRKHLPETMGSGCAMLDVDRDGRLDLFLVDSTSWPGDGGPVGQSRLYLNQGDGRFTDATKAFGVPSGLYGMGVAAGDYDDDGYEDVLITAVGGSRLLRNVAGRRLQDVTAASGIRTPGWSTSVAWLDYNRDGHLDLFVCHYVRWSRENEPFFSLDGVNRSYARPDRFEGEACQLFRNDGDRFTDVSVETGIANAPATKAMGVALCDFDRDGWVDVAVSNDTVPNFLFHNQGNGKFKEVGVQAGMAVAEGGAPKAGMGIDVADYANSGQEAILITNFTGEQLSLYRRDERGLFMDVAARAGIGTPSQRYLGFGTFFLDADLDGLQDIFVANGHIQDDAAVRSSGVTYAQAALLFRNQGDGRFADVTSAAGALTTPRVARGAACGDVDGDGDLDLLVTTSGGRAALLRQSGRPSAHWLQLRLRGRTGNRSAIGASVRVQAGGQTQSRMVRSGSSYLSQSSLWPTFGLGGATRVDDIEVRWPNGTVESFGAAEADRVLELREGDGR